MCDPASFVVTKKQVFWSKNSDSHELIIKENKLKEMDVRNNPTFVRVEIVPPDHDYRLPLKVWKYQLDQDIRPIWYNDKDAEKRCRFELKLWLKQKVINNKNKYFVELKEGEYYIINSTVYATDNSTVKAYGNSTVKAYGDSDVKAFSNSDVKAYVDSTVYATDNSTVYATDNSTVKAYGDSTVYAYGNSDVKAFGNSTVNRNHGRNITGELK